MSIKKFSTYIRGIITKAIHKGRKTLDTEEIIAEIREMILKEIDKMSPNQEVSGRIKVQMAIVPVDGSKWSGAPEEKKACSAFGLTTEESVIMKEFEASTNTNTVKGHCDVSIMARSSFISMMQSWVSQCLGSKFSYQVSLSDEQYLQIVKEFQASYRFIPEQSAVSPRGGAIIRELVYSKFNILLYITCLTELGPRKDLMLAWIFSYKTPCHTFTHTSTPYPTLMLIRKSKTKQRAWPRSIKNEVALNTYYYTSPLIKIKYFFILRQDYHSTHLTITNKQFYNECLGFFIIFLHISKIKYYPFCLFRCFLHPDLQSVLIVSHWRFHLPNCAIH